MTLKIYLNSGFVRIVAILTMLLALGPCLLAQSANQTGHFFNKDTIVVGAEINYPPYCILNDQGKADGFSIELMKAAAEEVGIQLVFKAGLWTQIRADLENGRIDALPVMGRTPEREPLYDFSMPYLTLHGAAFVRKGDTTIKNMEDLKTKEIAVMKGDNAEEYAHRHELSPYIFTYNTLQEAFLRLAEGQHDVLLVQHVTGLNVIREMGVNNVEIKELALPDFQLDYCFAVQKGNTTLLNKLNEGLSLVIANDTYKKIQSKWFGPGVFGIPSWKKIIENLVLYTVSLLLISVGIWIYTLRRQIYKRTERLNREVKDHRLTFLLLEQQKTQLLHSEEQVRLLLNSTAEGIYGIDLKGACTFINQAALKLLGFISPNEVLGRNMHHLMHHSYKDGSLYPIEACKIHQVMQQTRGTFVEGEMLWRSDGSGFISEYNAYPVMKNGRIIGTVTSFRDITKRHEEQLELLNLKNELEIKVAERTAELEEKIETLNKNQKAMLFLVEDLNAISSELKDERQKLEFSNHELEAFTYSVSHDLRAPLRAIKGYAEFILQDYSPQLDDEGKRFISVIHSNTLKMELLINDLLRLSRVFKANLTFMPMDMTQMAQSTFIDLTDSIEQENYTFAVHPMPKVFCDEGLMKQVWLNLIGNALKYSAKSPVKEIEIGAEERETDMLFYIKDKGAGFNDAYKNKLFGVFQRLHREDEFEGTGIGLATVQRIIRRHGGQVWAEGKVDHGATFYFTIPKKQ
jgi:PAS domain S-box-containing protein